MDPCRQKGGWLAEVDTAKKSFHLKELRYRYNIDNVLWLGASLNESEWRWSRDDHPLETTFTDWSTDGLKMEDGDQQSQCLTMKKINHDRFRWKHAPCTNWNHFVCELPEKGAENVPISRSNVTDFIGEKLCMTKYHDENGTLVNEADCLRFVKLQYAREKAQAFCHEQLGGLVARISHQQEPSFSALVFEEQVNANKKFRMGLLEKENSVPMTVCSCPINVVEK